ncbi:Transmembrane secretion effector [Pseudonocardia thermophila]|uniref:Transmembrane secretion effector n=1 Tax=Pseudonocardia thermophila TaxID=1848 RepID=A0A1M6NLI5_PSETH|nr:MFS transporter [Pseudonocardia thermophila]SHJ96464.1 Transmembrane secretion effector [Pseudonocardia thermophila]
MSSYRGVLRNAEFRAVLGAHVLTMLAIILADVALAVLVYRRTGSPLLSAVTFAVGFVPMGIGAVLLGGIGRSRPARDVLVTTELVVAGLIALMAVPGTPVPLLLALLAVKGFIDPVFTGTRTATLPEILGTDGFPYGRSLLRMIGQNAQLVGFAAGGFALVFVTPAHALLAAAAGHALAALVLLVGTRRYAPVTVDGPMLAVLPELRALLAIRGIRPVLAMMWLPGFFAVAPEALAVPYAHESGGGSAAAGLLLAGIPVGAVLGELLVGSLLPAARRVQLVVPLAAATFVPVLGYAAGPPVPVALGLLVLAGLGASHHIGLDQIAVAAIPEHARRRSFTLLGGGMMVSQGLGFAAAGTLAEHLPITVAVPLTAATGIVAVLAVGHVLVRSVPPARPSRLR